MLQDVCYLCGKAISVGAHSRDHSVPKQLLEGQQPKAKGFAYGGTLPTHKKCNNEFGPETYGLRALELLDVLHNPECAATATHPNDRSIRFMALRSDCLPNFGRREMRYFKISDRTRAPSVLPSAADLRAAEAVDPFSLALNTALAVLLKSAAAIVIKTKLRVVPTAWQVMAVPYVGDAYAIDFDDLLGNSKPFGPRVKVWAGALVTNDVLVVYRTSRVLVYFFFKFSRSLEGWRHMRGRFVHAPRLRFDGASIAEILRTGWRRV